MASIGLSPNLAQEIIGNNEIFKETAGIVSDIIAGHIDILKFVENLAGVLTNKEAENREKGMKFFTKVLEELPKDYLNEMQVKFISQFYIDRLKDHHRVIPAVLAGYLSIVDMTFYTVTHSGEFFTILFREVPCQSQVRQDRFNIFCIIQKVFNRNVEYIKSLGPDFLYGFITAIDGERDPRNLLFLFNFLPIFLQEVPIGHLVEEMFEIISCYYPIDFYPSPDDPAPVTRQDLANALCPCLCATPQFAEQCLVLLIEKLDSSLRLAKLDSLALLKESCNTFSVKSYEPFLKALWSSIHREISHKSDEELKMAAHIALSSLISKLGTEYNTDQSFENFVKGVLISMQTAIAESTTVAQFVQASKVLLTAANASKESCVILTKSMIPAIMAYYEFKPSLKLQIASIDFLSDLYELAKHWDVVDQIGKEVKEIPQLCLTAVSNPSKEYQITGFKNLIRVKDVLSSDLVLPFIEVLIHNVQHAQDENLLSVSVAAVHAIAKKNPEMVMEYVVKGKCDLTNLTRDKVGLQKRLNLLSNLASIDDFTEVIIIEMLNVITSNDEDAAKLVEALNNSMSNASLYTEEKVISIESDHGLIDSILAWVSRELYAGSNDTLSHGFDLIASTMSSLPLEKQLNLLSKHTDDILKKCEQEESRFHIIECLCKALHQGCYDTRLDDAMKMSLQLALNSNDAELRTKACILIAHFLNKVESGQKFELLYEMLKNYLSHCDRKDDTLCPRLVMLYGWITKALIMRGSESFAFWLQKIVTTLSTPEYCKESADAIHIIMEDFTECLNTKYHCRSSLLYKQRMYQTFKALTENLKPDCSQVKEAFLLSWAYVLEKVPKSVLNNDVVKIAPLVIEALDYDNKDLLLVMMDVLSYIVLQKQIVFADSLQTVMPRLVKLSKYVKSMDVRIKSLQCLFDIANTYRTMLLLPYKQDILLNLAPSLDDKKRLVRNVAVKARTRWFLVGAPGESKET